MTIEIVDLPMKNGDLPQFFFFKGLKFSLLMFKPFYGLYVVSVDVDLG